MLLPSASLSIRRIGFALTISLCTDGALGLAYPLFNAFLGKKTLETPIPELALTTGSLPHLGGFLQSKAASVGDTSVDGTYSTYAYQAACGVVGSILASWLVMQRIGRKGAMSFCTLASGVSLFRDRTR